jgi:hypothetical protein
MANNFSEIYGPEIIRKSLDGGINEYFKGRNVGAAEVCQSATTSLPFQFGPVGWLHSIPSCHYGNQIFSSDSDFFSLSFFTENKAKFCFKNLS